MVAIQKISLVSLALLTIMSISIIYYGVNLHLRVFSLTRSVDASIDSVEVVYATPSEPSVAFIIVIENPTELSLKVGSVWVDLYLNTWDNFVGTGFVWIPQFQAKDLSPFSNFSINLTAEDVSNVNTSLPRTWLADCTFWIYGIPLFDEGADFHVYSSYQELP